MAIDAKHHLRRRSPGHLRNNLRSIELNHRVELGSSVGVQGLPVGHCLIPLNGCCTTGDTGMARAQGTPLDVFDRFFIHGHQTRAGTGLDGHVADRHAAFHAQRADGRATELDGVARAASSTDLSDDGQHHVFGSAAFGQSAFDLDQHVPGFFGQ